MTAAPPGSNVDRVHARELKPDEHSAWSRLVVASPQGSVYALPEYLSALCRAAGGSFRIVGVFLADQLVGGVPLYERRARAGVYVANRLLLYYNGIVLDLPPKKFPSDRTAQALTVLEALQTHLAGCGYVHLQLHNRSTLQELRPFLANGWQASLSYTYVVPLTSLTNQWELIDPNLRRLIQRCEREGVTYREDDDFEPLFRLHEQTHLRKGAPLYLPAPVFRRFFDDLRGAGLARLAHAVFDGKVIASQLTLTGPHPVAHTVCAGADEAHLRMGASGFLRWHSFLALAREGYIANDLTDAALNPVTRFKSQLGGELTPTWSLSPPDAWSYRLESRAKRLRTAMMHRLRPGSRAL
jgi:Acetyltransferase (GNAT) domain